MVNFLSDTWASIVDKDVYKEWSEGIVKAITQESGLLDDGPLTSYLTKIINEKGPIKRKFMVSAVDVNTGTYVLFDEKNVTTYDQQVKAVVSSSSIPFVFPNQ
jgi:predicted acylesterase/phospholipase RssA